MSNNSKKNKFQVVYSNFDGLDVSFKGCVSSTFLELLEVAQNKAREKKEDALLKYGTPEQSILVSEAGMRGGYRYRFDTGYDGEVWAIKDSLNSQDWNIRISVKSAALAVHGYEGVKRRIFERLEAFEARVISESVARVDFAIDFLAPDFQLKPETFITHSQATSEVREVVDAGYKMTGNRVTYKRIGQMPGRQVVIYDKRGEVLKKNKNYWWDIWNLDKDNKENKVWRVELRAGKRHLKEKWGITTFAELDAKIGAILTETLQKVRMFDEDCTDSNVTRKKLHPFWDECARIVGDIFQNSIAVGSTKRVIHAIKEQKKKEYIAQLQGIAMGVSKLHDIPKDDILKSGIGFIVRNLTDFLEHNPQKIAKSYERISERYVFFEPRTGEIISSKNR